MLRTAALAALLCAASALAAADPPKAITDAIAALEKARADAKDPVEKEKLADAIAALKKVAEAKKIQNELISDFVDNRDKYAGRTLTFKVTYAGGGPLNKQVGTNNVPFTGEDPKNGAKLVMGADIPADLRVPAAKNGEEVVITFKVGGPKVQNTAIAITRP